MNEPKWDKYTIVKCPGCGALALDYRCENMVKFHCGSEVWEQVGYKPSLDCLARRVKMLEAQCALRCTTVDHVSTSGYYYGEKFTAVDDSPNPAGALPGHLAVVRIEMPSEQTTRED